VAGRRGERLRVRVDEWSMDVSVGMVGCVDSETRDCLYRSVDAAIFPSL